MTTVFNKNKPTNNWKGRTFQQISCGIKYNNGNLNTNSNNDYLFKSMPSKGYRKEIASQNVNCNPRTSIKIEDLNMPGGSNFNNINPNTNALVNTQIINYDNNNCQHPNIDNTHCMDVHSIESNALRRVRSSGMTKKKYDIDGKNNYFSSAKEYLNNRNISFNKNQYFNLAIGDSTKTPGQLETVNNVYKPSGINHCPKFELKTTVTFEYSAFGGANQTVTLNPGYYDVLKLNSILQSSMILNGLFWESISPPGNKVFLINFTYDFANQKVKLESHKLSTSIVTTNSSNYNPPTGTINLSPAFEYFYIDLSNSLDFANLIGFQDSSYPSISDISNQNNPTVFITNSINTPLIKDNYTPIYYKPSNSKFSVQGAVSSGDLITRKKYDTITTVGSSYRSAFGEPTANALAYGVSSYGYTIKDKIGYPIKKTPVISKSGDLLQCPVRKFVNII